MTDEQIQVLAQLLVGILKSQNAIIRAVDKSGAATRLNHFIPALQTAANLKNPQAQPTLEDLPSRILLHLQAAPRAGGQPLDEWIHAELTRLLP
jgi:hypothetical protein